MFVNRSISSRYSSWLMLATSQAPLSMRFHSLSLAKGKEGSEGILKSLVLKGLVDPNPVNKGSKGRPELSIFQCFSENPGKMASMPLETVFPEACVRISGGT